MNSTDKTLTGKNVAILVANGFEELHMTDPQRALIQAGATVRVISVEQGLVNGWHEGAWGHYFPVDAQLGSVLASDFDMLLMPGGFRSTDKLEAAPHTARIVKTFAETGRPMVAVGTGVALLALAGTLEGKTLAAEGKVAEKVTEKGAQISEETMITDGQVMTAREGFDMPAFIEGLTALLDGSGDAVKQAA